MSRIGKAQVRSACCVAFNAVERRDDSLDKRKRLVEYSAADIGGALRITNQQGACPRVAGNIANEDILGSLEFACKVAGAKVVLVMGHSACGAIKGAIDNVQLGNLTGLLGKIRPAVSATQYQGERSSKNYGFVDAVARKNVELTMTEMRRGSAVLADLERSGAIRIAGAMYDLESGRVEFLN